MKLLFPILCLVFLNPAAKASDGCYIPWDIPASVPVPNPCAEQYKIVVAKEENGDLKLMTQSEAVGYCEKNNSRLFDIDELRYVINRASRRPFNGKPGNNVCVEDKIIMKTLEDYQKDPINVRRESKLHWDSVNGGTPSAPYYVYFSVVCNKRESNNVAYDDIDKLKKLFPINEPMWWVQKVDKQYSFWTSSEEKYIQNNYYLVGQDGLYSDTNESLHLAACLIKK